MVKKQNLKEKQLDSRLMYRGHFLEARIDNVELPDKSRSKRFYIVHPGAAVIVAEIKAGHFLVIEQFRYALGKTMLEFPAGKRDHREATKATAKRELLEETGYASLKIKKLGTIHPCIGYSDEKIDVFYTNKTQFRKQQLDTGEFLNVYVMTKKQIENAIKKGKITDAKTLAAWTLLNSTAP